MKNAYFKSKFMMVMYLLIVVILAACNSSPSESTKAPASESQATDQAQETEEQSNGESFYSDGKPVEFVAPAAPGSGWDLSARSLAETFIEEDLLDFPIPVVNEEGADGAVFLAQLVTRNPEEAHKIAVTSTPIMYNHLRDISDYSYDDVTMIAQIMVDYYAIAVASDSPYETLDDLLDAMKEDPQSIPVGVGGDDRLPFALVIDEGGADAKQINFVVYSGGGETANALLNGDVQVGVAGPSELAGQVEAGELRVLAITSDKRLTTEAYKDTPTAAEQGIDVVFGNWRGIMGAPNMPQEAVTFWEDTIEKALQTETWKGFAERNQWAIDFKKGDELKEFLDRTNELLIRGMEQTGEFD